MFRKFFCNLCDEIRENIEKMHTEKIENEFTEMRNKLNKRIDNPEDKTWVGFGKTIIIWIMAQKIDTSSTSYYRYLPSNEFRNFMARGYYSYIKKVEEPLTLFYFECDSVSIITQNIESNLNHDQEFWSLASTGKIIRLKIAIDSIRFVFDRDRHEIENIYYKRGLQSFFNKNILNVTKIYLSELFRIG